jgi:hypothetical protein
MKTKLSSKIIVMVAITSAIVLSCSKESDPTYSANTPPPTVEMKAGYIVDYGLVNENTRLMYTSLSSMNQTLSGSVNGSDAAVSLVEVSLYSNEDGLIPSGDYTFTTEEVKSPFTFESGAVSGNFNNDGYVNQPMQIVNGLIKVMYDGDKYTFTFSFELASGMAFDGSFSDKISYSDLYK